MGSPDHNAPVLVTANYKLTFDTVRSVLAGQHLWLLVTDTRGINVWCAGGKELFSARTITEQITRTGLHKIVTHKRLILPQLGANGVNAREIRKATGFDPEFGPVRAEDIPRYLAHGADEAMREVTFTLRERAEVIPVELMFGGKPILWAFATALLLSLIGPDLSAGAVWSRWLPAAVATLLGVLGGTVLFPLVLPWLQLGRGVRFFSTGGALIGLLASLFLLVLSHSWPTFLGTGLWCVTVSSWLALNFTGSTPYTSPSGVEREMRRAIPLLAASTVLAVILYLIGNFH